MSGPVEIKEKITTSYKPYPKYKDSGVEWLGKIPESWEIKRLRFLSSLNPSPREIPTEKRDSIVSFIPMEAIGVQGGMNVSRSHKISDLISGYTYFSDEDVVVAKITPCFENGKGAIAKGLSEKIGFGTTELFVLRNHESLDPKFLFYLTMSQPFRKVGESYMYGAGGQKRIPESFVRDYKIAIPSIDIQEDISNYLDLQTSKIDSLLQKKERFIELLQEKRTALITHAVTKGLESDVPMKYSGVKWLGEIPKDWEIKRLRFLLSLNPSPREIPAEKKDSIVSFIPMEAVGIQGGMDVSRSHKISDLISGYTYFSDEDVVVAKITPCFENGKGAIAKGLSEKIGFGTTELFVLRNSESLDPNFLFYFTISQPFRKVGESYMYGAGGQKRIPENFVRNFTIGVPSIDVQKELVLCIELEISKIDFLVQHTLHSIELLKEYRSALITAAVTGKIDLREEVLL